MAHKHKVQKGDTLIGIAHAYGFGDWQTIWARDENAALRSKRDPQHLSWRENDEVFIPDKGDRWLRVSTDKRHVFEVSTPRALLQVVLTDGFGDPWKQEPFTVTVGVRTFQSRTSVDGLVECDIPPDAKEAVIRLDDKDLEWHVKIGGLAPLGEVEGVQGALENLGYLPDEHVTGAIDADTTEALKKFQTHAGLRVTGEVDDPTRAAIEAALFADGEAADG
jgi:hypothetical protein